MFDPTYGYINRVLSWFGINGPAWLVDPNYTKWALVLMGTWNIGTTMLVCLAALQEVPHSYYESAEIDGANAFVRFFRITLPCVAPVIVYQAILNIINAFQYFTQVYVIINASSGGGASDVSGGPANSILMYTVPVQHGVLFHEDGSCIRNGVDSVRHRRSADRGDDDPVQKGQRQRRRRIRWYTRSIII